MGIVWCGVGIMPKPLFCLPVGLGVWFEVVLGLSSWCFCVFVLVSLLLLVFTHYLRGFASLSDFAGFGCFTCCFGGLLVTLVIFGF